MGDWFVLAPMATKIAKISSVNSMNVAWRVQSARHVASYRAQGAIHVRRLEGRRLHYRWLVIVAEIPAGITLLHLCPHIHSHIHLHVCRHFYAHVCPHVYLYV